MTSLKEESHSIWEWGQSKTFTRFTRGGSDQGEDLPMEISFAFYPTMPSSLPDNTLLKKKLRKLPYQHLLHMIILVFPPNCPQEEFPFPAIALISNSDFSKFIFSISPFLRLFVLALVVSWVRVK